MHHLCYVIMSSACSCIGPTSAYLRHERGFVQLLSPAVVDTELWGEVFPLPTVVTVETAVLSIKDENHVQTGFRLVHTFIAVLSVFVTYEHRLGRSLLLWIMGQTRTNWINNLRSRG